MGFVISKSLTYCPSCQNDVDDIIEHLGICEECEFQKTASVEQKRKRKQSDLVDLFESGHDVDLTAR